MPVYTDQTGNRIEIPAPPRRIVSIVPSQTELLYDLGLEEEVVGITKFCIHPEAWFRSKTRVGGTKQLNTETIQQLNPDLVIANKEENVKVQVEELARHYRVWISNIHDLDTACGMISSIGEITGRAERAGQLVHVIRNEFTQLQPAVLRKAVYLIWQNPYMTVGGDTFIHHMLEKAGFINLAGSLQRYPVIELAAIRELKPEVLLLSSEPYPFKEKHRAALEKDLPGTKVLLADGEYFSWYGSRLLQAPGYFRQLQQQIE